MIFDHSSRLRKIRAQRRAQDETETRAMFDRSRGTAQQRLVEVVKEFEWLSPQQKSLLLREPPTFYLAVARLHAVFAVVQQTSSASDYQRKDGSA